ncbi:hypothetical protein LOC67_07580 [Stieleria sp. JC731]|uniref:cell envelope integrity protein TolA n=1 Tax=Pirellulaceae TaxID=2691357 RepID=UPI001E3DBC4A|nr:hypothetical protein [Stieleria sp. JC731]MCC9600417.1 hypothetical protein [Stieleria sp. JC731]
MNLRLAKYGFRRPFVVATLVMLAAIGILRRPAKESVPDNEHLSSLNGQPALHALNHAAHLNQISADHHDGRSSLIEAPLPPDGGNVRPVNWLLQTDGDTASSGGYSLVSITPKLAETSLRGLQWPIDFASRLRLNSPIPVRPNTPFELTVRGPKEETLSKISIRIEKGTIANGDTTASPFSETVDAPEPTESDDGHSYSARYSKLALTEETTMSVFVTPKGKAERFVDAFSIIPVQSTSPVAIGRTTHSQFADPTLDADAGEAVYLIDSTSKAYLRFDGLDVQRNGNFTGFVISSDGSPEVHQVVSSFDIPVSRSDDDLGFIATAAIPTELLNSEKTGEILITTTLRNAGRIRIGDKRIKFSIGALMSVPKSSLPKFSGYKINGNTTSESINDEKRLSVFAQDLNSLTVTGTIDPDFDVVIEELSANQKANAITSVVPSAAGTIVGIARQGTSQRQLHRFGLAAYVGRNRIAAGSQVLEFHLLKKPLEVERFDHNGIGTTPGANKVTLRFPTDQTLKLDNGAVEDAVENKINLLRNSQPDAPLTPESAVFSNATNTLTLTFAVDKIVPDGYQLQISGLKDVYGNELRSNAPTIFPGGWIERFGINSGNVAATSVLPGQVIPGIQGPTGDYVTYQEWTPPREIPDGFKQSDKVETRVAPLYFYRDAHRVAQIINRKVKSHNRHGVSVARQHADQARTVADQTTAARQESEREAIRKAQETRELQEKLSDARRNFDRTLQQLRQTAQQKVSADDLSDEQSQTLDASIAAMEQAARSFSAEVERLETAVDTAKQAELDSREQAEQLESREQLARQEQFRREVFAAHSDPDTYAEGQPSSSDPVEQTSISVIGEGLIHLRGPLKGVNQIRLMINQIDTPVGQVRVNVHTTQLNGDDAKRLETVASRIQTYIDQARFMTVQTGEMIRKSVMLAAAQRAQQASMVYPGETQEDRDQRYLHAFFGKEFIDELRTIDSEFLQTGNKLLSLHSMDVTSLSSALLLMSLANNETRILILDHLDRQLREDLPIAEQTYLDAGMHHSDGRIHVCTASCGDPCCHHSKVGHVFSRIWDKHHGPPPLTSLSQNAAFQSLKGFYSVNHLHADTMTPLQREFIRLAQIFKSRLVTELEYKQRVMERALIEDRIGNRQQDLRTAKQKELDAARELFLAQQEKSKAIQEVVVELTKAQAQIRNAAVESQSVLTWFDSNFSEFINDLRSDDQRSDIDKFRQSTARSLSTTQSFYGTIFGNEVEFGFAKRETDFPGNEVIMYVADPKHSTTVETQIKTAIENAIRLATSLSQLSLESNAEKIRGKLEIVKSFAILQPTHSAPMLRLDYKSLEDFADLYIELRQIVDNSFKTMQELSQTRIQLLEQLKDPESRFTSYYSLWQNYRTRVERIFQSHPRRDDILFHIGNVDAQFDTLLEVDVRANFKIQEANDARRPLDHKRFLDMLIDDLEEKYIELLEGTRAHTANIDNYLKRLTTALDDDFNTQFYYPTFRNIREGGQYKDVEFGQTETTNVLANNRAFAKVSPSATMEFDLPKRDILIREGLDSALAIYNDVGALVNDPNLLALAASQSGLPTSQVTSGASGTVRDVLPGLSSDTQADLLAQDSGTRPRYESNVEKLIPDPAIYKFETGTGYEIRPVIEPDGQSVVFDFNYMYTTNVREPVRADEKHLGRVKRHFVDTDVQLSNFELREVSRYTVALKAERTARGVPLLEDIPVVGALWRPVPQRESSLQQNIIMAQATIFPTLFDLMGLRWAPAVADIDPLNLSNREFIVRGRHHVLENRVYDVSSSRVDEFLRFPESQKRADLYRSQSTVPSVHPNGYQGPGLDFRSSELKGGWDVNRAYPESQYVPDANNEGAFERLDRSSRSFPPAVFPEDPPGTTESMLPYPGSPPTLALPEGPDADIAFPDYLKDTTKPMLHGK